MTPEVLQGFLWKARSGIRTEDMALFAGHGIADPNYRPPRLPYVSIIGPLNLEIEAERELPQFTFLWMRTPGYLQGLSRIDSDLVPATGQLHLRFDGDATMHLNLDFTALAGQSFNNDDVARQVAAIITGEINDAVNNDQLETVGGEISDSRRNELIDITVRWNRHRKCLVIASGRRGVVSASDDNAISVSRVEVLAGAQDLADALGLRGDVFNPDGRMVRHRVPLPKAVAVDVRFDLWAGSQRELATLMDAWAKITPTRGQLMTRPSLLAQDVMDGSRSVTLQQRGEIANAWTLLQLEGEFGFNDRLSQNQIVINGQVSVDDQALSFTNNGSASILVYETPAVPRPDRSEHPARSGYALTLGLRVIDGSNGQQARVARLMNEGQVALDFNLQIVRDGPSTFVEFNAQAQQQNGSPFGAAVGRVLLETAQQGINLHALVNARSGIVILYSDGNQLERDEDAPGLVANPGLPMGGSNMELQLGGANTVDFSISYVQLHGRPFGPSDPQLRLSLTPASSWNVGDPIVLANTPLDAYAPVESFNAVVTGISGNELQLDRPVVSHWPLTSTMVYRRALFFSQKQLRRRDDFMNELYRISAEYRVSTFLEEPLPSTSAPLVEQPSVDVRDYIRLNAELENPQSPDYPLRPACKTPGISSTIVKI